MDEARISRIGGFSTVRSSSMVTVVSKGEQLGVILGHDDRGHFERGIRRSLGDSEDDIGPHLIPGRTRAQEFTMSKIDSMLEPGGRAKPAAFL